MTTDEEDNGDDQIIKLKRGYDRGQRCQAKLGAAFDDLGFREGPRRKTKKRHELSTDEVVQIVDATKVDKLAQREVAAKFGVSARLVSQLVIADRKDPDFRQRTRAREMKRREKLRSVLDLALRKLHDGKSIIKAADIKAEVLAQHGIKVSTTYVCGVLRHDIGAKYARVKRIPFLGNSPRCLLLRQHYAKFMLAQLAAGARVINLDQTWINTFNFAR